MLIVLFRALFLYVLIIFGVRMMGKRQLGELQPSELVITFLISNLATLSIENLELPLLVGAVPVLILIAFEIIVSSISLKSRKFRKFISGTPIVIIKEGKIIQKALRETRFTIDDLMEELRNNSIFDIQEVYYAIIETNGKLSILKKFDYQSVTPKLLNINGEDNAPPVVIISDGGLVNGTLKEYGLDRAWLDKTLKANKQSIESVFLMTADKNKNYFIIPKEKV